MRFDSGTTDIPSAGTRVQISNTKDKVKSIAARGRAGNVGNVYFGRSDVSSSNGWELEPGDSIVEDFGEGSEFFDAFYGDAATSGDDIDWVVILWG